MAAKFFLVLCASALFANVINAQCVGYNNLNAVNIGSNLINAGGCGCGYSGSYAPTVAYSNGGGLGVTISSPIAPSGIQLISENAIEGILEVAGTLPLIAGVAFDGTVPSSGAAGTTYSCGNGNVGITSESLAAAGLGGYGGYGNIGAGNIGAAIGNAELIGLNAGINAGINGLAGLGGCGGYGNIGAAIGNAELIGLNAGINGLAGLGGCGGYGNIGAAIGNAELIGLNAGINAGINGLAGSRLIAPGPCGCNGQIYY